MSGTAGGISPAFGVLVVVGATLLLIAAVAVAFLVMGVA